MYKKNKKKKIYEWEKRSKVPAWNVNERKKQKLEYEWCSSIAVVVDTTTTLWLYSRSCVERDIYRHVKKTTGCIDMVKERNSSLGLSDGKQHTTNEEEEEESEKEKSGSKVFSWTRH